MREWSRREFIRASGVVAGAAAVSVGSSSRAGAAGGSADELAREYYRLLLQNTRFQETTWSEDEGSYGVESWDVVGTLGNAVLLRFDEGQYDEELAGVSRPQLHDHTVRSLAVAVTRNRFVNPDGGTWGARIYWDSTMESYLVAAARLMWSDLDATTRAAYDEMTRGEANYLATVGANPTDPDREGGTTNGLQGGYLSDTKMEEMGARTMMLAAADAYLPRDSAVRQWREWLTRWTTNTPGLPVADRVNPTVIAGRSVADWNTAQNIFDTFTSENHGTWNGMYEQSPAVAGRNVAHYLIAGLDYPRSQVTIPNADEIFDALNRLGTDAGVPAEFGIGDRQHLYGRSVLPVAYRATVCGDRLAARAERMLVARLGPYVNYPPEHRLVKFGEGTKYETEARAEVAIAFLLHYFRPRNVDAVSEADYFRRSSGVTDFGAVPGIVAHQSSRSLVIAQTKPGYVKFAFLPNHDDWFVDPKDKTPCLLPSVAPVDSYTARTYSTVRDGIDATAIVVRRGTSYAGMTSLPDGSVVYATSGTGDDEGSLRLFNLDMPGMPGLQGNRTFTTGAGAVTLAPDGLGNGGTETLTFAATEARHVRMVGVQAQSQWGYSIYEFAATGPDTGDTNLALGQPASASTFFGDTSTPDKAVDGDPATRWANSATERPIMTAWWAVDLGQVRRVDRVSITWQEDAWPLNYRIEVSTDDSTWTPVAGVPRWRTFESDWLNVEGRAGFVVRGSSNPIAVAPQAIALSHGPADGSAGMVVQAFAAQSADTTKRLAATPQPSGGRDAIRAALTDRVLSIFNLGGDVFNQAELAVPQSGSTRLVYRGAQRLTADGLTYEIGLDASSAVVEQPRFEVTARIGLEVAVFDSHVVQLRSGVATSVRIRALTTGESHTEELAADTWTDVAFTQGSRTPTDDLARGRITYPTSPLPPGMTDPDRAVDGDPSTAWLPGASDRRLVVNLGRSHTVIAAETQWTRSGTTPSYDIESSDDGLAWRPFASGEAASFVSVLVEQWRPGMAGLVELTVR